MVSFSKNWFFDLEKQIRNLGADSDAQSFDEIRENLSHQRKLSPIDFADMCAYVILAGGFSQKTAKRIHKQIMDSVRENGANFDTLFSMFHNKNKINAICEIWNNKNALCAEYYRIDGLDEKLKFLSHLPHIGKITANHLARNLGENVVKYDIWIQRLGVAYGENSALAQFVDNGKLNPEIKKSCDEMFAHLSRETGLPIGYLDVVLWKACQLGLIKL